MDTSVKSHLEMLSEDGQNKSNFISWKFKLDLTLKSKGLYVVATGVEVKPEGLETDDRVRAWNKKDIEAQTLIGLNVSSNIAKKIANCTSSHQMLEKLKLWYGEKSELNVEHLQRSFFNFKYDQTKSAIENCMSIQYLSEELSAEGEVVKESWIMSKI